MAGMEPLSRADIQHLSHLARLTVSEDEAARYATQLTSVVEYITQLSAVDTNGVNAAAGVTGLMNVLAADEIRSDSDPANLDPYGVLQNAPLSEGDYFEVRAVFSETEAS